MADDHVCVLDLTPGGCAERRLAVVSELGLARETVSDGHADFLQDAVAPRGEWREPTSDELSHLLDGRVDHSGAQVLVVPTPELARVMGDHLSRRDDFEALRKAVRDLRFVRALEASIDELIPFCLRTDGLLCQGAWVSPGGMELVTHNMNLAPPRRIGLHVDNWDDLPLPGRARGRKRLCVNLGLGPRYLIFLPTPLSALVARGTLPREIPDHVSPAALVRAYLRQHLQQTAVRFRIDPGEAYIMNADDVIHDAASDTSGVPDVALHFLGHFGAGPCDTPN